MKPMTPLSPIPFLFFTILLLLLQPASATIPLAVSLSVPPTIPHSTLLSLTATTTNTSPSSPLTLLTWDTPLDTLSPVLGLYNLTDLTTHTKVKTHHVSVRRPMPPAPEDFVQIDAGGSAELEVTFELIRLVAGHEYEIRVEGWWRNVWEGEREEVLGDEAKAERLEGSMRGEFVSEGVVFRVASE